MTVRRLPWTGEGGKPVYLSTDGDSATVMTRLADNLESVHLGMASDLLEYVDKALTDQNLSVAELRSLIGSLCQSVRDLARVAQCRGERLPMPPEDDEASRTADAVIDREIKR
jgi:hypothetical protein